MYLSHEEKQKKKHEKKKKKKKHRDRIKLDFVRTSGKEMDNNFMEEIKKGHENNCLGQTVFKISVLMLLVCFC